MNRPPALGTFGSALALGLFPIPWQGHAQEASAPPVTTRSDPVAQQVNEWFAAGTAAGNRGDFYDNRDSGHSRLNLSRYPQLQPVPYSEVERKQRRHHGPASKVHPFPTLGNASLAAPATNGGSLPRITYHTPRGLRVLQTAYFANNLYVYPEHQDHDPGLGDLFPLNAPYLVISQGSSGSDRPFLRALALTMASFTPEVKRELVRNRLLAPTLQHLLRRSNRPIQSRDDYLTGVAHPTVFPGAWLDEGRMVEAAHEMTPETIPPVVQLQVVAESPDPKPGIEVFEVAPLRSEFLAEEPSVIARVFRSTREERWLRIRAHTGPNPQDGPVRIHWRLLRGDPERVTITPSGAALEAEIRVRHHPEPLPVPGQPEIRSTRVDIGVFADNGVSLSAPAFVCIYMLPSEWRVFDENGRLRQIDYRAPSRRTGIPPADSFRWANLLERVWQGGVSDWGGRLLAEHLSPEELRSLRALARRLQPQIASYRESEAKLQPQTEALQEQRSRLRQLEKEARASEDPDLLAEAERQRQQLAEDQRQARALIAATERELARLRERWERTLQNTQVTRRPLLTVLETALNRLIASPDLYRMNRIMLEERARSSPNPGAAGQLRQARDYLIDRRILLPDKAAPERIVSFAPLARPENRFYRETLNRVVLSQVLLPDVLDYEFKPAFADPRLTSPKDWRDLFLHDEETGELLGWKRMSNGEVTQYDARGRLLTGDGPVEVSYQRDPNANRLEVVRPEG